MRKTFALLLAALALSSCARRTPAPADPAQNPDPRARAAFSAMDEAYRRVERLRVESESFTREDANAEARTTTVRSTLVYVAPGRFRLESRRDGAKGAADALLVSDGADLRVLDRGKQRWMQRPAPMRGAEQRRTEEELSLLDYENNLKLVYAGVDGSPFVRHLAACSRFEKEDVVEGAPVDVLRCDRPPPDPTGELDHLDFRVRLAIGRDDHLLRLVDMELRVRSGPAKGSVSTSRYAARVSIPESIAEDAFRFEAPVGAERVQRFNAR